MPDDRFRILVVCTANMCRSPLAEHLLAGWITADDLGGTVSVESAGSDADPGEPMCPGAAQFAGGAEHAARRLTADIIAEADLVLALDRTHRSACARLVPACRPRLFTLRQAGGLAQRVMAQVAAGELPEGAPPLPEGATERLRWLVAELDAGRGQLAGRPEGSEDIEDRHGPAPHPGTFAEVADAVTELTAGMSACLAERG